MRLKGGDPYVFGRGGEEAEALLAAGVPFEVVPGHLVGAGRADGRWRAPHHAQPGVVVHGAHRPRRPGEPTGVDWEAHARTGATLVVLMGAGRIGAIAKRLLVGGLDADTPVVAVHWACTEREQVLRTTLSEVGHAEVAAPCTFVIGDVAGLDCGASLRCPAAPSREPARSPAPALPAARSPAAARRRVLGPGRSPAPAPSLPGPGSLPGPVPTAAMPRRSRLRSDSTPRR